MKKQTYRLICQALSKLSQNSSGSPAGKHSKSSDGSHLIVLEDRVLYDAAPFDVDASIEVSASDVLVAEAVDIDWADVVTGTSHATDGLEAGLQALEMLENADILLDAELQGQSAEVLPELVVVDSAVENYDQLLQDLTSSGNVEVLVVDSSQNGFQQVGEKLKQLGSVSAVHIISHGNDGELQLGNALLSLETLATHSDDIASWKEGLSDSADLLFYGCDLATDGDGQMLLSHIVDLTDADVAASTDLTGHDSLGGDWTLEFESGTVQTEVIVTQASQELWQSTLLVVGFATAVDTEMVLPTGATDVSTARQDRGSGHSVAMDDNGNYVIVWSENTTSDGWEVMAAEYAFNGNLIDSYSVNENASGDQQWASVAMDDVGNYVVTWTDFDSGSLVMGRYIGVDGFDSGEFIVGAGQDSSVTMNDDGRYAFTWEELGGTGDFEIRASYYEVDHSLIRGDFLVEGFAGNQRDAELSMNSQGELAIFWETDNATWLKRFDTDGSDGSMTLISIGPIFSPTVELRDDGYVVVAATELSGNYHVGFGIFDPSNTFVTAVVTNDTVPNNQFDVSLEILNETDFAVTWSGYGDQAGQIDVDGGVFLKTYSFDSLTETLTELTSETRVNSFTTGDQRNASIAAFDENNYVVVWDGATSSSVDGISHKLVGLVNQAPDIVSPEVFATQNIPYEFKVPDFGYSDTEGDPFTMVRIDGLPTNGELLLEGSAVVEGQEILVAEITKLVWIQTEEGYGEKFDGFYFSVHDGNRYSLTDACMDIDVTSLNRIWLTTRNDVSGATDVPGPDAWSGGEALQFSGTNLDLDGGTDGYFSQQFNLENFVSGDIDALHYVTQSVDVGPMTLNDGDIVFSTNQNVTLPGIGSTVQDNDIVVFRSTSADYTTGIFTLLFDYSSIPVGSDFVDFNDLKAFSIAEQDTMIGDHAVMAGQILFTANLGPGANNEIFVMDLTSVGEGSTDGTSMLLVDGSEIGINRSINGLELVERDSDVGGFRLVGGTVLVTVDGNDANVGGSQFVEDVDVVALEFNTTSVNGPADAEAEMFFDGSEIGFVFNSEFDIDGLSVLSFDDVENEAPIVDEQTFDIDENSPTGSVVGTVIAHDDSGDVLRFDIVGGSGAGIFTVDQNTGLISVADATFLDHEQATTHSLHVAVTDSKGLVDIASMAIDINDLTESSISGNIYNDVNANGNIIDDLDGALQQGFDKANVFLYRDTNGNFVLDADDVEVRNVQTDSDGQYFFDGLDDGNFFVVVQSTSLEPHQLYNSGFDNADVWAEQTWGSAGSRYFDGVADAYSTEEGVLFGGRNAMISDDVSKIDTMEHVTHVKLSGADEKEVDFGFSFNVVTNIEGGDLVAVDGQTVQGSFRQFLINANAIDGSNEMRFVPVVDANQGDRGTWRLDVSELLPVIIDAETIINGQAYSGADGFTEVDGISGDIGLAGTTVGTDGHSLATIDRPEFELYADGSLEYGLRVEGDSATIDGVRFEGFGTSNNNGSLMVIGADDVLLLHSHLFGAFGANIVVDQGGDAGTVANNVIESAGTFGIKMQGDNGSLSDWIVRENYILNNAQRISNSDGIDIQALTTVTVVQNLFQGNLGSGIDSYANTGSGLTISQNTIIGNGIGGVETSGIRLYGMDHSVTGNVITDNAGAGVYVVADGPATFGENAHNEISMNHFGMNGGIAIDLGSSANNVSESRHGDGISDFSVPNSNAGNHGIQSPVLTSGTLANGDTVINGTAGPNQRIEFYQAVGDSDGSDDGTTETYGEGVSYLGWAMSDSMGEFSFTTSDLGIDDSISAIAIDSTNNTSEFSFNIAVNSAPESDSFIVEAGSGATYDFTPSDFVFEDLDMDTFQSIRFIDVPTEGQLFNGATLLGDGDTVLASDIGNLSYVAPTGLEGSPLETIDFVVFDGTIESQTYQIEFNITNAAPTFDTPDEVFVDENSSSITVEGTDPENDSVTYHLETGNDESLFTIDAVTGVLSFNVTPDFENPHDGDLDNVYEVELTIKDSLDNSTTKLVSIHVEDVNEHAPDITTLSFDTDENVAFSQFVEATDLDPTADLTFSLDPTFVDGGQFTIDPDGLLKMVSVPDFENPMDLDKDNTYIVRVFVSDGINTDMQEIQVHVAPVNDNLHTIETTEDHDVNENTTPVLTVETADEDDPASDLTFSIKDAVQDGHLFQIDESTGELSFISAPNFENPTDQNGNNVYVLFVQAEDSDGNVVEKRLKIHVLDVNEPITGVVVPDNVDENSDIGTTLGFITAIDQDNGDTYDFQLLDDAGGRFAVHPVTGELVLLTDSLNHEAVSSFQIQVQVTDSESHMYTEIVTIAVNDINEDPVAVDLAYSGLNEGGLLTIDASDLNGVTDPDGDDLNYTMVGSGSHGFGRFTTDGDILYRHDGSENFVDTLYYRVADGKGGFDIGEIDITINPVNDAPQASGEQFVQTQAGALVITQAQLLANDFDPDGPSLEVVVVNGPDTGRFIERPDGSWFFVPDSNTPAVEQVFYYVTDGLKNSNIVVAELFIPFPSVEVEPEAEEEAEVENEVELDPNDGGPVGSGDPDGDTVDDIGDITGPAINPISDNFGNDNTADELESGQYSAKNQLSNSSLLITNYGFSYQKSSFDLSESLSNLDSRSILRFGSQLDSLDSSQVMSSMWKGLDKVNEEMMENISSATGSIKAAASLTGLATAVYVFMMARGGVLVASVVSSIPAWQSFDPLPILQYSADNIDPDADDDSIESLLDRE